MSDAAAGRLSLPLPDEAATARLADDIAAVIQAGDVVALSGGLGAGKTTFARALLRALSGDPTVEVPSPTFPLRIDHHLHRLQVAHVDLFRLGATSELGELGLEEALMEGAVIVEWPERLPAQLAANRLDVRFELEGSGRRAEISAVGSWRERLSRTMEVRRFLDRTGWNEAARFPMAGDASSRAYERVALDAQTAILMNAPRRAEGPPLYDGRSYDSVAHRALDVRPFVAIGLALREAGVRAPAILATHLDAGLLLLEDLGSEGVLDTDGVPILERYEAAIDLLVFMHARKWPRDMKLPDGSFYRLPPYDRDALLIELSLFPDWFGGQGGEPAFPPGERGPFLAAWSEVLEQIERARGTLVMRDFHSPNILWQQHVEGMDRVGVIDFQDALFGHPAYDVASLAQDARAPLEADEEKHLKARYIRARMQQDASFDREGFETAYAVLGAQRATKVLGIFTRLALVDGKPGYQQYRTRLKELIRRNLEHPVLSPLRLWYHPYL
jgi:tRNA threonylcarbamoyl adenosine modification protein YjeE